MTTLDLSTFPIYSTSQLNLFYSGKTSVNSMKRLCSDDFKWLEASTQDHLDWSCNLLYLSTNYRTNLGFKLEISGTLCFQCLRCSRACPHHCTTARTFRFVRSEAEAIDEEDDSDIDLLVWSKELLIDELVEDEAILSLPLTIYHADCTFERSYTSSPPLNSPFTQLKSLTVKK